MFAVSDRQQIGMSKKKVLVVDDDEDILEAVRFMLSDAGYDVVTQKTALGIEDFVRKQYPDLIILDVLLSGHDGREVTRMLRQMPNFRHIPVILISAHPSTKISAKACGANDFLAKPFDIEVMLQKIREYTHSQKVVKV